MPIRDFEYYHGAVLTKILRSEIPTTLRLIETNVSEAWSAYKVNDEIVIYMKYSANPRKYKRNDKRFSWVFNFQSSDLEKLSNLMKKGTFYLTLICTQKNITLSPMEVCLLNQSDINYLIDVNSKYSQSFTVYFEPGKQLLVRGTLSPKDIKVPRNRIETVEIPA